VNTKPHTVYLDANGVTSMVALDINNVSTDNCAIATYAIDKSNFTCADVGPVTVTLTVTDVNGNAASNTAIVTVVDNILPTVLVKNHTAILDANGSVTITVADINNGSFDNCTIATMVLSKYTFTCADLGANIVTLTVTDVNGNTNTNTATVTVVDNIFPTITCPTITNPYSVNNGCNYVVSGSGFDATGADNCSYTITNSVNNLPSLDGVAFGIGTHNVVWTIVDAAGNSITCTSTIIVKGYTVSGNINYHNVGLTIMNGVAVTLTGPATYNTTTDANGYYEVEDVCLGTYDVTFVTGKQVGGINATDALQVNNWGLAPNSIEKVRWYAGDVNEDGLINAGDAGDILDYFIFAGNSPFWMATNEWYFWNAGDLTSSIINPSVATPQIVVGGTQTNDFLAMVVGDFNRSFVPGGAKGSASIILTNHDAKVAEANTTVELPVTAGFDMEIAAASLMLNYPADKVEVLGVTLGDNNVPVQFSAENGTLIIGWTDLMPINLKTGDALFTLQLSTTSLFTKGESVAFTLVNNVLVELAEANGMVLPGAVLNIGVLNSTTTVGRSSCRSRTGADELPNPFNSYTTFNYTIPANGKVTLEVYDLLGRKAAQLVNAHQSAGQYTTTMDAGRPDAGSLHRNTQASDRNRYARSYGQDHQPEVNFGYWLLAVGYWLLAPGLTPTAKSQWPKAKSHPPKANS
jgi:hypothetical protein